MPSESVQIHYGQVEHQYSTQRTAPSSATKTKTTTTNLHLRKAGGDPIDRTQAGGSGKVQVHDISITKPVDQASPK
jgi:type VI protein secretion system component Hcp